MFRSVMIITLLLVVAATASEQHQQVSGLSDASTLALLAANPGSTFLKAKDEYVTYDQLVPRHHAPQHVANPQFIELKDKSRVLAKLNNKIHQQAQHHQQNKQKLQVVHMSHHRTEVPIVVPASTTVAFIEDRQLNKQRQQVEQEAEEQEEEIPQPREFQQQEAHQYRMAEQEAEQEPAILDSSAVRPPRFRERRSDAAFPVVDEEGQQQPQPQNGLFDAPPPPEAEGAVDADLQQTTSFPMESDPESPSMVEEQAGRSGHFMDTVRNKRVERARQRHAQRLASARMSRGQSDNDDGNYNNNDNNGDGGAEFLEQGAQITAHNRRMESPLVYGNPEREMRFAVRHHSSSHGLHGGEDVPEAPELEAPPPDPADTKPEPQNPYGLPEESYEPPNHSFLN